MANGFSFGFGSLMGSSRPVAGLGPDVSQGCSSPGPSWTTRLGFPQLPAGSVASVVRSVAARLTAGPTRTARTPSLHPHYRASSLLRGGPPPCPPVRCPSQFVLLGGLPLAAGEAGSRLGATGSH